jgi:hypothetical protein
MFTDVFDRIGSLLTRRLRITLRINTYQLDDDTIVRNSGLFKKDAIKLPEIASWSVTPEMGFDIVLITLNNGRVVQWIDDYNDLLRVLREKANDKRVGKW